MRNNNKKFTNNSLATQLMTHLNTVNGQVIVKKAHVSEKSGLSTKQELAVKNELSKLWL